ncbi:hypothetical protein [Gordonia hankookensis]|uniref:Uncharacterized protein n=1 Tax=Gordonia hankookensis TaxID=589403 RepID=A0ABR7W6X5_9ACTN|nr:hypothetical protein [Gordonia hankookensis]MBD1318580.1 hypothetical protein [Gordonia hankookensis]
MNGINLQASISVPVAMPLAPTATSTEFVGMEFRRDRFWVDKTHVRPLAAHVPAAAVVLADPAIAGARAAQRFPVQIRSLRRR